MLKKNHENATRREIYIKLSDGYGNISMQNVILSNHKIGIGCIGSGVGQSIVNSLRLSSLPVQIVGLGTNPFAYGAYDCDFVDYTVKIYDESYIDNLLDKCIEHSIDLMIPGLEDEVQVYAQNEEKFDAAGVKAIFPDQRLVSLCRDKYRLCNELNSHVNVFARCFSQDKIDEHIEEGSLRFPCIAKLNGGFASRGVRIIQGREDVEKLGEGYILQELAAPSHEDINCAHYLMSIEAGENTQVSEISIQIVCDTQGGLIGRMATYNKLTNGVPVEIVPYDNGTIWEIVDQLCPVLLEMGLRGPLNLQGRMTDSGLKLFEMNPRFTGITGLRTLMGFNEVEACVKEWLWIASGSNKIGLNTNRFGLRQTADRAVSLDKNSQVRELSTKLHASPVSIRKRILLTGASGYLGRELAARIEAEGDQYELIALGRSRERLESTLKEQRPKCLTYDEFNNGGFSLGTADILIHAGFARPHCSY